MSDELGETSKKCDDIDGLFIVLKSQIPNHTYQTSSNTIPQPYVNENTDLEGGGARKGVPLGSINL